MTPAVTEDAAEPAHTVEPDATAEPEDTAAAPETPISEPQPDEARQTRHSVPAATKIRRSIPRAINRPWAKTKAVGAALAVGGMIAGVALPSLSPSAESVAAATAAGTSALLADAAQSYSTTDEIRAEIAPRGDFSATTPEEIDDARSKAVAAALSAGMPLGAAVTIPVAGQVVMPMASGTYSFTDGFGASRPGRSHLGQDFAAPVGAPINAVMDGCVSRSTESFEGYGVTIQIESVIDGQAVSTAYSHMSYGTRAVEVGECVTAGQHIGDVGSTGYVFGSCLHFEVHVDGGPIDPMPWLTEHVS